MTDFLSGDPVAEFGHASAGTTAETDVVQRDLGFAVRGDLQPRQIQGFVLAGKCAVETELDLIRFHTGEEPDPPEIDSEHRDSMFTRGAQGMENRAVAPEHDEEGRFEFSGILACDQIPAMPVRSCMGDFHRPVHPGGMRMGE